MVYSQGRGGFEVLDRAEVWRSSPTRLPFLCEPNQRSIGNSHHPTLWNIRDAGKRIDTAEVWGSSPHAPTNRINNLRGKRLLEAAFHVVVHEVTPSGKRFESASFGFQSDVRVPIKHSL